jgi:hypothetical protein
MRKYKYKVIKKKSRMSAVVNGNSKYAIRYLKGYNAYAREGTLGIMVFDTRGMAQFFMNNISGVGFDYKPFYDNNPFYKTNPYTIIRVLPIGRGKTIHEISPEVTTIDLDSFYNNNILSFIPTTYPPDETMVYPGVFVVD